MGIFSTGPTASVVQTQVTPPLSSAEDAQNASLPVFVQIVAMLAMLPARFQTPFSTLFQQAGLILPISREVDRIPPAPGRLSVRAGLRGRLCLCLPLRAGH